MVSPLTAGPQTARRSQAARGYRAARHLARHLRTLLPAVLVVPNPVAWALIAWKLRRSVKVRGRAATRSFAAMRVAQALHVSESHACPMCRWTTARRPQPALPVLPAPVAETPPPDVPAAPEILVAPPAPVSPLTAWFRKFRPTADLLASFRARTWPHDAPAFTVLMPVYNPPEHWLRQAVESVAAQTYPYWELVCVNDGSPSPHVRATLDALAATDARIRVVHLETNLGVAAASNRGLAEATGDYVCFMDHDDYLEPQALHRFAEAALADAADMIYSDEAQTGADLEDVVGIVARSQFSYDNYLSHPYFVHLVGVRTELLNRIGGFNERLRISQDIDLMLRVIERARSVSHVPDVLYRWRTHGESLGHARMAFVDLWATILTQEHLTRVGCRAEVRIPSFNFRDVTYPVLPSAKVAILIPSKNHAGLLRQCVESLERTVAPETADVYVIDHDSDEPEAIEYLAELRSRHRIIPYSGPFNFSAIVNHGVRSLPQPYTHYLLLNNDTEAHEPGWLEHMLGLACREDVGIVGATLLYPNGNVQHAGVGLGLGGIADHLHRFHPLTHPDGTRWMGYNGGLVSTRDYSAVTGACQLVRADLYEEIGGMDERIAVGYGDVDLCLRTVAAGRKVLCDAWAILTHHESVSRGTSPHDPHPVDTRRFVNRYATLLRTGDPFYSPLLSWTNAGYEMNPDARSLARVEVRTVPVVLPRYPAEGRQRIIKMNSPERSAEKAA